MRILLLTPRYPYPPFKGDQLRASQVLASLSLKHEVTAVSFRSSPAGKASANATAIETIPFSALASTLGVAHAVWTGSPLQTGLYATRAMRRVVARLLPAFDIVHLNTLRMANALPDDYDVPLVVDFVDALGASTERYAAASPPPRRAVLREEARRLRRFEQRLAARAAAAFAVSEADAQAIAPNVRVARHGVDAARFSPPADGSPREGLVFSGNLAYPPNRAAALSLVRDIFPRVRESVPAATLRIVGVGALPELENRLPEGVIFVGKVADMAHELGRAAVAVAPIRFGGGVQTKVLEAMACGTPVVATPFANAGIGAVDGEAIVLAESDYDLADAIGRLLEDPERRARLGRGGRAYIETHFALEAALAPITSWYDAYG